VRLSHWLRSRPVLLQKIVPKIVPGIPLRAMLDRAGRHIYESEGNFFPGGIEDGDALVAEV
jgi:hypothetical protein